MSARGVFARFISIAGGMLVIVGFAVALGCSRRAQAPGPAVEPAAPPPSASAPAGQRGASAEELGRVPQPPPPEPPPPAGAVNAGEGWVTTPSDRLTFGYRVQIFASSQRERGEQIAAEARTKFREPVYVEYDSPFYKVRVGDCITRAEADALKERASALGYEAPWVAETKVLAR